ncbi:MAG: UDP-2,3-diacylglucosamine diphosphatase LpxI [Candidatus Melainabacteria bacterium]|nr:UDP-2,3-diacylglucosamine diphosphatase LpxI [Candidatus Melainabacteria bacterium]
MCTLPSTTGTLAIMAGEGELPLLVAKEAVAQGFQVIILSLTLKNQWAFEQAGFEVHRFYPGLWTSTKALLRSKNVSHVTFAGKFNKWLLFTNLRFDGEALQILSRIPQKNDDGLTLGILASIEAEGFAVLPQTRFMKALLKPETGLLTDPSTPLKDAQWLDMAYGFSLAKTMGQLDVGQTVVVHETMILAVEAIEGTDACLHRAGELAKKRGGTVVKTAKPQQDDRFDVPAVGLRTLRTMKKAGLTVLATEANATIYLDFPAMKRFAEANKIAMVGVCADLLAPWQAQLHMGNNNPIYTPLSQRGEETVFE